MVTGKNYYGTPGLQSEPVGKPLVVSGFDLADQVTNGLQLTMITGALGTGQQISAYAVLPNLVNPGPTIGQPAPWQAGIFSVGDSGFNLGVGASKTLVAASQAVLYVHAVHFWTDAAGAVLVQLQDDASTPDLVMTGRASGAGSCRAESWDPSSAPEAAVVGGAIQTTAKTTAAGLRTAKTKIRAKKMGRTRERSAPLRP